MEEMKSEAVGRGDDVTTDLRSLSRNGLNYCSCWARISQVHYTINRDLDKVSIELPIVL